MTGSCAFPQLFLQFLFLQWYMNMLRMFVSVSFFCNFTMTGHLYKSAVHFLFSFNGTCYQLVFVSSNIIFSIFTMTVYLCHFLLSFDSVCY